MRDPYDILGVDRRAGADAIKSAFRALAKRHHPDAAEAHTERFSEVTMAYALLSDPEKRARFDRGEIGVDGAPRRTVATNGKARANGARPAARGPIKVAVGDVGQRAEAYRRRLGEMAGRDAPRPDAIIRPDPDGVHVVALTLEEAAAGAIRHLAIQGGEVLELKTPEGVRDGQRIRVKVGHGMRDADVEVRVTPHAVFRRVGADLHVDVAITLYDAALGAKVAVPTLTGPVSVTLPPRFDGSRTLRLKGKGMPDKDGGTGDLFARPRIILPPEDGKASAQLVKLAKKWAAKEPYTPPARVGRQSDDA